MKPSAKNNPPNKIRSGDIIRYRVGATALMRMDKFDDLCGYRTYHGIHLYGDRISITSPNPQKATQAELKIWMSYKKERGRNEP